jgi:hypothetical protein
MESNDHNACDKAGGWYYEQRRDGERYRTNILCSCKAQGHKLGMVKKGIAHGGKPFED